MASSARIDELRKKFDENPRRYFAPLANEYRKAGDLEQAIFICQEYLPQQPGHMSGHIVYGQALFEAGRFDEARAVFETALALDPENLIALRHLGDIARQAGDNDTARNWYQRVLEADPRNEEIAGILSSLLTAPPPPQPMPEPEPEQPEPEPEPEPVKAAAPDWSADEPARAVLAEPPPPPPVETPAPFKRREPEPLFDLDEHDMSFGHTAAARPAPPAPEPEPMMEVERSEEGVAPEVLSSEEAEAAFEADPFAIAAAPAATPQAATPEQPTLEEPFEPFEPAEFGKAIEEEKSVSGLEVFDGQVEAPPQPEALDGFMSDDLGVGASELIAVESAPVDGGHAGDEAPPAPPDPSSLFVTETMAELYLQQGHFESALDIYKRLVQQRPDDAALRGRLEAVEARLHPPRPTPAAPPPVVVPEPEPEPEIIAQEPEPEPEAEPGILRFAQDDTVSEMEPTPAFEPEPGLEPLLEPELEAPPEAEPEPVGQSAGPTIREFLSSLLFRHPAADGEPEPARAAAPSAPTTVSGSIDALFAGAGASSSDVSAASALADAFASEGADTSPLEGVPAHRASSELSLDHVFKASTPAQGSAAAANFSFDQFFADDISQTSPSSGGETAGARPEASDDIAQFNAWLNGLKKT